MINQHRNVRITVFEHGTSPAVYAFTAVDDDDYSHVMVALMLIVWEDHNEYVTLFWPMQSLHCHH